MTVWQIHGFISFPEPVYWPTVFCAARREVTSFANIRMINDLPRLDSEPASPCQWAGPTASLAAWDLLKNVVSQTLRRRATKRSANHRMLRWQSSSGPQ